MPKISGTKTEQQWKYNMAFSSVKMSKKMYPKKSPPIGNGVNIAKQYDIPTYKENGAGAYIEFRAYDPELGKMRRKTIKLNRIKGIKSRREYARGVIKRLSEQLRNGWNPWIAKDVSSLFTIGEAIERYTTHIEKMLSNGYFRKETYDGYKSYVKILSHYIDNKNSIFYCYQFDRKFCVDFLDYIFIERNNGAQTRNNYLNFLRVFCGFLVEKGYLSSKPTDGITPINKRLYKKERGVIPSKAVVRIAEYCKAKDPHFLFACYLLYYCFIRPVEMTRLKIENFNLRACTLTIPGQSSKNKTTQTVTIPKKVILYGVELGIFSCPIKDYIFSDGLKPGPEGISTKLFRDHWEKVRRALGFKKEWKFYSLKDTGITELCNNNVATIAIRDQARHSSLAITDIYTGHATEANKDIIELDGSL